MGRARKRDTIRHACETLRVSECGAVSGGSGSSSNVVAQLGRRFPSTTVPVHGGSGVAVRSPVRGFFFLIFYSVSRFPRVYLPPTNGFDIRILSKVLYNISLLHFVVFTCKYFGKLLRHIYIYIVNETYFKSSFFFLLLFPTVIIGFFFYFFYYTLTRHGLAKRG